MWEKKKLKNRNPEGRSVKELVMNATGMSEEELLCDKKEYHIEGISEAAQMILSTIREGKKIHCFTDYDADGIMSALILDIVKQICGAVKGQVRIQVPKRFSDGYGIKERNVEKMDGHLLVTADNGIAAAGAVRLAKEKGMKVIVLDHHMPLPDENGNPVIPDADILIDPHITKADYQEYCGAGLCYRLLLEVLELFGTDISEGQAQKCRDHALCYAAIATVGDSVPLTGENRRIVREGLLLMGKGRCSAGLSLLLGKLWLKNKKITSSDLSFTLVPCINAWGRLEDAGALKTVITFASPIPSEDEIQKMIDANTKRKSMTEAAIKRVGTPDSTGNALLIVDTECPLGIAGIVAGRLSETYKVPAIILTESGIPGLLKGSGRAPEGMDLKTMLDSCPVKPDEYGGHPGACGLSVRKERVQEFFGAFHQVAGNTPKVEADDFAGYDIVADPDFDSLTKISNEIGEYGPYGVGCPEPVVLVRNIRLLEDEKVAVGGKPLVTLMGSSLQHAKLHTECSMEVLMFSGAADYTAMGEPMCVNATGFMPWKVFKGQRVLSLQAEYVEPA